LIPVLILILIFSMVLSSCKNPCQTEQAQEFIKEFKNIKNTFDDKFELAGSTSRINLTPVISDMQDLKRELDRLEPPEKCSELSYIKKHYLEGMDTAIDAFMMFQLEENEFVISLKIDKANVRFEYVDKWIKEIEGGETISKTIDVLYVLTTTASSASITYSNEQGETEQMNDTAHMTDLYKGMNDDESLIYNISGLEEFIREDTKGMIVSGCPSFPKNEFLYISAQIGDSTGSISVLIIVDDKVWKSSTSHGEYAVAEASGYYEE